MHPGPMPRQHKPATPRSAQQGFVIREISSPSFSAVCQMSDDLAAVQHRSHDKQALLASDRVVVVIEELETALTKLDNCEIRRCTHRERSAALERRKHLRGVDGVAGDDV